MEPEQGDVWKGGGLPIYVIRLFNLSSKALEWKRDAEGKLEGAGPEASRGGRAVGLARPGRSRRGPR